MQQAHGTHYQRQALETASPAQLILMLFDRALQSLRLLDSGEAGGDIELVNRELQRVQDIVTELQLALDFERGEPVASQLSSLYTFCLERLVEANVRKDLSQIDDVRRVLAGIRDAWGTACVQSEALAVR